jgi:hypothetical protein
VVFKKLKNEVFEHETFRKVGLLQQYSDKNFRALCRILINVHTAITNKNLL